MGVVAGLYMYDVVVKKFTFAISSPDEFLVIKSTCSVKKVTVRGTGSYIPLQKSLLRSVLWVYLYCPLPL